MAKDIWWEEEDEFGYTYADTERPGYMAQSPVEMAQSPVEEELSEETIKFLKLKDKGGYEDKEGGDFPEEDVYTKEASDYTKLREPGAYEDHAGGDIVEDKEVVEVETSGEPNIASQKEIRKLMGLASKAKGPKKADAYSDVIEA